MMLWLLGGLALLVHSLKRLFSILPFSSAKGYDVHKVPGPVSLPLIGTSWIYLWRYKITKIHEAYEDMVRRYGPVVMEEPSPSRRIVNLADRRDIEKVLRYPSRYPFRPPSELIVRYRELRPDKYANGGFAHVQGEIWHTLRSKTTAQLTSAATIFGFLPELNAIGDDFMQLIRKQKDARGDVEDFYELSIKYGLEACSTLVLGQRMAYLSQEISSTAKTLDKAIKQRFSSERDCMYSGNVDSYMKTSDYRKFEESEEQLYNIISEIVETATKSKEMIHDDIKSILVSIAEKEDLDARDKRSTLIDFIAAGISTLSSTLAFVFFLLSKHPECQERIYRELEEVAPNSNDILVSEIVNLAYTKACIYETFRLIPVAFGLSRLLEEDMTLGGYRLPKGMMVFCHTRLACQNEENFTRAKEFVPERWLNEKETQTAQATGIFAPFGIGKRMCPGKKFTEQALIVILAKTIRDYVIGFDGNMNVEFQFILSPKTPVKFNFKDRC